MTHTGDLLVFVWSRFCSVFRVTDRPVADVSLFTVCSRCPWMVLCWVWLRRQQWLRSLLHTQWYAASLQLHSYFGRCVHPSCQESGSLFGLSLWSKRPPSLQQPTLPDVCVLNAPDRHEVLWYWNCWMSLNNQKPKILPSRFITFNPMNHFMFMSTAFSFIIRRSSFIFRTKRPHRKFLLLSTWGSRRSQSA